MTAAGSGSAQPWTAGATVGRPRKSSTGLSAASPVTPARSPPRRRAAAPSPKLPRQVGGGPSSAAASGSSAACGGRVRAQHLRAAWRRASAPRRGMIASDERLQEQRLLRLVAAVCSTVAPSCLGLGGERLGQRSLADAGLADDHDQARDRRPRRGLHASRSDPRLPRPALPGTASAPIRPYRRRSRPDRTIWMDRTGRGRGADPPPVTILLARRIARWSSLCLRCRVGAQFLGEPFAQRRVGHQRPGRLAGRRRRGHVPAAGRLIERVGGQRGLGVAVPPSSRRRSPAPPRAAVRRARRSSWRSCSRAGSAQVA